MISGAARLAGVMGWPVSHSLSPKLHNYWIKQLQLDAAYLPLSVHADNVKDEFRALPKVGFAGWNVTVPHKEVALQCVDEVDEAARAIGAVNTVTVRADGSLLGSNTDAYGFAQNLQEKAGKIDAKKAVVLGAGGAARAVVFALKKEGFGDIVITNRTQKRAEELAEFFEVKAAAWEEYAKELGDATLLVNTTTLGMAGQPELRVRLEELPKDAVVADIVYKPLLTELLKDAQARGLRTVTGLGMLIHQAVPGFEAWFGLKPEVTPQLEEYLLS